MSGFWIWMDVHLLLHINIHSRNDSLCMSPILESLLTVIASFFKIVLVVFLSPLALTFALWSCDCACWLVFKTLLFSFRLYSVCNTNWFHWFIIIYKLMIKGSKFETYYNLFLQDMKSLSSINYYYTRSQCCYNTIWSISNE